MAGADGTDDLAFAAGKLEYELAVVHGLGLEHGEGRAFKGAPPVHEAGVRDAGEEVVVEEGHGWRWKDA